MSIVKKVGRIFWKKEIRKLMGGNVLKYLSNLYPKHTVSINKHTESIKILPFSSIEIQ